MIMTAIIVALALEIYLEGSLVVVVVAGVI
jgi:hypothetical protein